jgi:hypothetical protein
VQVRRQGTPPGEWDVELAFCLKHVQEAADWMRRNWPVRELKVATFGKDAHE